MKYIDFKAHLDVIMSGDKTTSTLEKLKPIIFQCLKQVAMETTPLVLISNDTRDEILQAVEGNFFIRVPKINISDDDIVDIDEILVFAVCYLVASKISKNQNILKYERDYKRIVTDYKWQRYKDIESGIFNMDKTVLENRLNTYGYKKIYTLKVKTILGYKYIWDDEFISVLNNYLMGIVQKLSKSDRINIDEYLEYQQNGAKDNEMYEALDKYLGEING